MTAIAATAAPNPDDCHPLSVGHCRLNITPVLLLGGRDALKTRAAKALGTPGPSLAADTSRRSRIRSAANLLCFVSSAARSASIGGRRSAIQRYQAKKLQASERDQQNHKQIVLALAIQIIVVIRSLIDACLIGEQICSLAGCPRPDRRLVPREPGDDRHSRRYYGVAGR